MSEDETEVEKYKRLYEEQRAKVKELERQNSQLKDAVQQLMAAGRQAGATKNTAGNASLAGQGGGDGRPGGQRGPRARGGGGARGGANPPPPPNAGTSGAGGGGGGGRGRGGGAAGGAGGGNQRASQPTGSSERQDGQDSAAEMVAAAAAAVAARKAEPEPSEPDVRGDIVAQLREASMGKDVEKLEAAIKKADEAGLSFEANQGRRQLTRIKG